MTFLRQPYVVHDFSIRKKSSLSLLYKNVMVDDFWRPFFTKITSPLITFLCEKTVVDDFSVWKNHHFYTKKTFVDDYFLKFDLWWLFPYYVKKRLIFYKLTLVFYIKLIIVDHFSILRKYLGNISVDHYSMLKDRLLITFP